jgi:hypothetical protein
MTPQPFATTAPAASTSVTPQQLTSPSRADDSTWGSFRGACSQGPPHPVQLSYLTLPSTPLPSASTKVSFTRHAVRLPPPLRGRAPAPHTGYARRGATVGPPRSEGGLRVAWHRSMHPQRDGARVNDSHSRRATATCVIYILLSSPRRAHGVTQSREGPSFSAVPVTP